MPQAILTFEIADLAPDAEFRATEHLERMQTLARFAEGIAVLLRSPESGRLDRFNEAAEFPGLTDALLASPDQILSRASDVARFRDYRSDIVKIGKANAIERASHRGAYMGLPSDRTVVVREMRSGSLSEFVSFVCSPEFTVGVKWALETGAIAWGLDKARLLTWEALEGAAGQIGKDLVKPSAEALGKSIRDILLPGTLDAPEPDHQETSDPAPDAAGEAADETAARSPLPVAAKIKVGDVTITLRDVECLCVALTVVTSGSLQDRQPPNILDRA